MHHPSSSSSNHISSPDRHTTLHASRREMCFSMHAIVVAHQSNAEAGIDSLVLAPCMHISRPRKPCNCQLGIISLIFFSRGSLALQFLSRFNNKVNRCNASNKAHAITFCHAYVPTYRHPKYPHS